MEKVKIKVTKEKEMVRIEGFCIQLPLQSDINAKLIWVEWTPWEFCPFNFLYWTIVLSSKAPTSRPLKTIVAILISMQMWVNIMPGFNKDYFHGKAIENVQLRQTLLAVEGPSKRCQLPIWKVKREWGLHRCHSGLQRWPEIPNTQNHPGIVQSFLLEPSDI